MKNRHLESQRPYLHTQFLTSKRLIFHHVEVNVRCISWYLQLKFASSPFFKNPKTITSINIYIGFYRWLRFPSSFSTHLFSWVATTLETGRDQWLWLRHANHFYTSKIGEQSDRNASQNMAEPANYVIFLFYYEIPFSYDLLLQRMLATYRVNLRDCRKQLQCLSVSQSFGPYKLERSPIYQFPADVWKVFE